jgi:hypothetical protein
MRKDKNTPHVNEPYMPVLKVVNASVHDSQLEFEIERHVKSIRTLIGKLRPLERQRYYDGLLSHILSRPIDYPSKMNSNDDSYDYCNLSYNELSLIRELSMKIHELYRISEEEVQH